MKIVVTDYEVVWDRDLRLLVQRARELVKEGWEPQGGISSDADNGFFMQAMVKYEFKLKDE